MDWNLHLESQIPLKAGNMTYAGEVDLDFSGTQLTELLYMTSATSSTISLPAHAGHSGVKIQANSSYLVICIPPGVAAYIHSKNKYYSYELDTERFPMIKVGEEYKSANYNIAENRVDILLDVAGTFVKLYLIRYSPEFISFHAACRLRKSRGRLLRARAGRSARARW